MSVSSFAGTPSADSKWAQLESHTTKKKVKQFGKLFGVHKRFAKQFGVLKLFYKQFGVLKLFYKQFGVFANSLQTICKTICNTKLFVNIGKQFVKWSNCLLILANCLANRL